MAQAAFNIETKEIVAMAESADALWQFMGMDEYGVCSLDCAIAGGCIKTIWTETLI